MFPHYQYTSIGGPYAGNPSNTSAPPVPPDANFSGTPRSGVTPLSTVFTNTSTGDITGWLWQKKLEPIGSWTNFAGNPTAQNPTENFTTGDWGVRLTATGPGGEDTHTYSGYIQVSSPPPPPAPTLVSAAIASDGTSLTVEASENITGNSGFSLWRGFIEIPVTFILNSGASVYFTTSTTIYVGQSIFIDYTPGNIVSDPGGEPMAAFSGEYVSNNSIQPVPINLVTAFAEYGGVWFFYLTFSGDVTSGFTGFTFTQNYLPITINYVGTSGSDITFSTDAILNPGSDVIQVSYTPGDVVGLSSFSGAPVTFV